MKLLLLPQQVLEHEIRIMKRIQMLGIGTWLERWVPMLTQLGGAHAIIAMTVMLSLITKDYGKSAAICLVSHLIVNWLKKRIFRVRPYERPLGFTLRSERMKDPSFPSGHTAAIWTVTVQVCLMWPMVGWIMVPIALFVGWTRVYLGLHYPGDVLAGALIGAMIPMLVEAFT